MYPSPLEEGLTGIVTLKEDPVEQDPQMTAIQSCYKAAIPIARLWEPVDQDDFSVNLSYRCPKCSQCMECKHRNKVRAMSVQEHRERVVIEESVTLDLERRIVTVQLPFMRDPVKYLVDKHRSDSNYDQAIRVYISQCQKEPRVLEGIRKAHMELIEKGFMVPLESLDEETIRFLNSAPLRHYYLWRVVYKEDSLSTPVRLVLDPTMSGLNLLLAKGENRIGSLVDIILRNRAMEFAWTSNVTKLYNQLHLERAALPYSLFLYHEDLDPSRPPMTFVMRRAWYKVVPTGNQAGYALELLVEATAEEFPAAVEPLTHHRYVDDVVSGAEDPAQAEQIDQSIQVLAKGGFKFKHIPDIYLYSCYPVFNQQ